MHTIPARNTCDIQNSKPGFRIAGWRKPLLASNPSKIETGIPDIGLRGVFFSAWGVRGYIYLVGGWVGGWEEEGSWGVSYQRGLIKIIDKSCI